jgi:ABC-type sugar transport system ATPase subunit
VQKITQRRAIVEEEITLILGENTSYLQARRRWETQKRIFELRFGEPL